MPMYASGPELASYLQKDLDASSATLALTLASGTFANEADTSFEATAAAWSTLVDYCTVVRLPFAPVTAVTEVRLNGVVITGWTLRQNALYRLTGFGRWCAFPPDELEVDLTHGYTTALDDVKLAVLEIAAGIYEQPGGLVASESIDDYTIRYNGTPIAAGLPWREVAAKYRGVLAA